MLPLLLTPTAWHQPARRPASRRSCTAVPRTCAARMEGAYKVEVLPPIGEDSSLPQRGKGAVLGEESVGIVFELVFRDIKMLSRTALQRPWPVVFELAQERLDMVVWFARYKADQCNLRLHDEVARSLDSLPAPRRVKSVLAWHRAGLKTQLVARRKDLWPTLRTLLQRPSMHERIVLAARSQALQFKQSSTPDNSRLALLGMPRRALSLWLAFWQASPGRFRCAQSKLLRMVARLRRPPPKLLRFASSALKFASKGDPAPARRRECRLWGMRLHLPQSSAPRSVPQTMHQC